MDEQTLIHLHDRRRRTKYYVSSSVAMSKGPYCANSFLIIDKKLTLKNKILKTLVCSWYSQRSNNATLKGSTFQASQTINTQDKIPLCFVLVALRQRGAHKTSNQRKEAAG